jgi:hypothetical protein
MPCLSLTLKNKLTTLTCALKVCRSWSWLAGACCSWPEDCAGASCDCARSNGLQLRARQARRKIGRSWNGIVSLSDRLHPFYCRSTDSTMQAAGSEALRVILGGVPAHPGEAHLHVSLPFDFLPARRFADGAPHLFRRHLGIRPATEAAGRARPAEQRARARCQFAAAGR